MIEVVGLCHVGIRVRDLDRALGFYRLLGFEETWRAPDEPVVVLHHPAGLEINLIVNAAEDGPNVLMDVPVKAAGYTHVAWTVPSLEDAMAALAAAGIPLSGGPVTFSNGARSIFVRDPDRNVVELTTRAP